MVWHIVLAVLLVAVGYDLYLRLQAIGQARARAQHEEQARLENREAFYAVASREFERARRYGHPFTMAYFDLDDFREIHDAVGRDVAEALFGLAADTTRASLRGSDSVARLGGNQFALLLPETGPNAAAAVVEKLRNGLRRLAAETALPLVVSGGVVTCLPPAESLEAILGAADRLLAGAKAAGPDTFWTEVIAPQPLEGFESARLRRADRLPPGFDVTLPPSQGPRQG